MTRANPLHGLAQRLTLTSPAWIDVLHRCIQVVVRTTLDPLIMSRLCMSNRFASLADLSSLSGRTAVDSTQWSYDLEAYNYIDVLGVQRSHGSLASLTCCELPPRLVGFAGAADSCCPELLELWPVIQVPAPVDCESLPGVHDPLPDAKSSVVTDKM